MRLIWLTLFFLSFQIIYAQADQEVLSLMTESKMYIERKKYPEAFTAINKAIEIEKENPELLYIRAEVNFNLDNYNDALKDYEKALKYNPDFHEALNGIILSMSFMGRTKEAMDLADEAIKKNPAEPIFYYSRGIVNNEREKYSKAIDDFDRALELGDNNEFRVFLSRGVTKLNIEEFSNALEDLNMAIDLDNKNPSAYHSRGRVYYETKDYDAAIKDFEISLELNPENEVAYYNLGMTYYRLDKMEEACSYFQESCNMKYSHACKMIILECNK